VKKLSTPVVPHTEIQDPGQSSLISKEGVGFWVQSPEPKNKKQKSKKQKYYFIPQCPWGTASNTHQTQMPKRMTHVMDTHLPRFFILSRPLTTPDVNAA
jgi:hypothetical protein